MREPDPEHLPAITEARDELIEGIIAESEDETLMDRYLAGEEIDTAVLIADLEKAVARGHFYPVVPVCAETGVGLDALLGVMTAGFPSPLEHDLPPVTGGRSCSSGDGNAATRPSSSASRPTPVSAQTGTTG